VQTDASSVVDFQPSKTIVSGRFFSPVVKHALQHAFQDILAEEVTIVSMKVDSTETSATLIVNAEVGGSTGLRPVEFQKVIDTVVSQMFLSGLTAELQPIFRSTFKMGPFPKSVPLHTNSGPKRTELDSPGTDDDSTEARSEQEKTTTLLCLSVIVSAAW
jgi:hypothetical protein